ncbi:MAG: hypothetical protein WAV41_02610 [Microgenomates group bacterium]
MGKLDAKSVSVEKLQFDDKINQVIKDSRYVGDEENPVIFHNSCGVEESRWAETSSIVEVERQNVANFFGLENINLGNIGVVIVNGEQENIGMACASASINRLESDKLVTDGVVLINMAALEVESENEGVDKWEIFRRKCRHEYSHIALKNYCAKNKIDVNDPNLRIFSELIAVWNEQDGDLEKIKLLVDIYDKESLDEIPLDFPKYLGEPECYRWLPSFFASLAVKYKDEKLPLNMLDKMMDGFERISPQLSEEGLDSPEKQMAYLLTEIGATTVTGESGIFGDGSKITERAKSAAAGYLNESHGIFLEKSWTAWAVKTKFAKR